MRAGADVHGQSDFPPSLQGCWRSEPVQRGRIPLTAVKLGTNKKKDAPSAEEDEPLLLGPQTDPCLVPAVSRQHLHCHLINRPAVSYYCLKAAIKYIICVLLLTVSK